ncbi:unnamed protein product [Adineta ricciae]|uniref:PRA1 family protein n=1 Tax=Adineta ricciae TaxID=249248 RepID=A0A815H9I5_ADIRI|nr:unnamed protein product [Adineta ricciae]
MQKSTLEKMADEFGSNKRFESSTFNFKKDLKNVVAEPISSLAEQTQNYASQYRMAQMINVLLTVIIFIFILGFIFELKFVIILYTIVFVSTQVNKSDAGSDRIPGNGIALESD